MPYPFSPMCICRTCGKPIAVVLAMGSVMAFDEPSKIEGGRLELEAHVCKSPSPRDARRVGRPSNIARVVEALMNVLGDDQMYKSRLIDELESQGFPGSTVRRAIKQAPVEQVIRDGRIVVRPRRD